MREFAVKSKWVLVGGYLLGVLAGLPALLETGTENLLELAMTAIAVLLFAGPAAAILVLIVLEIVAAFTGDGD
jgi:hypothetical protein